MSSMQRASGSGQHGLLPQHAAAAAPSASDSSFSSPHVETLAAGEEEALQQLRREMQGSEPQLGDDARWRSGGGVQLLRPLGRSAAASEIEEAPPSPPPLSRNQAALDSMLAKLEQMRRGLDVGEGSPSTFRQGGEPRPGNEARWCAAAGGGVGFPRRPLGPSAASEIEELPPSPPPPPYRSLLAPNAAAVWAGPAGMAGGELERKRAAAMESRLEQLRRERGGGGERASSRRPEGGQQEAGGAAEVVEMLEREAETMRDRLVALRLQQEEMQALWKSLHAWEEFWKPVPVPQRKNSKIGGTCNWICIISGIAFASGSVLVILFPTLLPLRYHTLLVQSVFYGYLAALPFVVNCLGNLGLQRVSAVMLHSSCVCFLLLVLYSMYLISRLVHLQLRFDQ